MCTLDRELLKEIISTFRCVADSKDVKIALETLITIHRNILQDEENEKFRKIRINNQTFWKKIWNLQPAQQFMYICGWMEVHDWLVFSQDCNLALIIEVLTEYLDGMPMEYDYVEPEKSEKDIQLKEDELKEKAKIEREKELAKYRLEKKYREDLAEQVKAEIAADNQRRKAMQSQDEHKPT